MCFDAFWDFIKNWNVLLLFCSFYRKSVVLCIEGSGLWRHLGCVKVDAYVRNDEPLSVNRSHVCGLLLVVVLYLTFPQDTQEQNNGNKELHQSCNKGLVIWSWFGSFFIICVDDLGLMGVWLCLLSLNVVFLLLQRREDQGARNDSPLY